MKQMDICKHCKKRNNCEGFVERKCDSFRYVYFCPKFVHDNDTPFSQADRIRSMSDEELADFIEMKQFFALANNGTDGEEYTLKWLQSEV